MSELLDRYEEVPEDPIAEYYGLAAFSAVEEAQRRRRHNKIALAAAGMLLLIAVAGAILWFAAGPASSVTSL